MQFLIILLKSFLLFITRWAWHAGRSDAGQSRPQKAGCWPVVSGSGRQWIDIASSGTGIASSGTGITSSRFLDNLHRHDGPAPSGSSVLITSVPPAALDRSSSLMVLWAPRMASHTPSATTAP